MTAAPEAPDPVPATVVERLRASTRAWHDSLEATPFASAMIAGTLPVERYVGQLAAYRPVLETLEADLSRVTGSSADPVWSSDLRKLPLIDRDLAHFANLGIAPGPSAAQEAEAFTAEIRERAAASDLPALLGFLYVMEGSTLGALVLHPYVTASYRLSGTDGVAYYTSGDRDRWARLTARMNQALTDPVVQDRVVAAAHSAYRHAAAITGALSEGLSPPSPSPSPTPVR
ncbi:biliverdin-producing heme oxygenase [Streptomyces sp. ME02-8801-2C]|uniref:biliverdin-producing heme oxygenase n=1 Tax=Streptomyces sp. ME02-8801-2C TaxID=3028680 RepID=UPI0029B2B158|nr:biliverdin-producing heme oxygenase [Streptomyces sp. ME02-8801-2C]MDX3454626.1 biliverdin-producing heme oxygenase [Streptomyces sp. ME02-8801-2C]